jgi:hypothetical protein
MKKLLAYIICSIGVLLPWRLRILFAEALGWIAQGMTLAYFFIVRMIIRALSPEKSGTGE